MRDRLAGPLHGIRPQFSMAASFLTGKLKHRRETSRVERRSRSNGTTVSSFSPVRRTMTSEHMSNDGVSLRPHQDTLLTRAGGGKNGSFSRVGNCSGCRKSRTERERERERVVVVVVKSEGECIFMSRSTRTPRHTRGWRREAEGQEKAG